MRSEKEMMDLVLSLAEQDERIRIVTLEGSRANINIPKDFPILCYLMITIKLILPYCPWKS